MKNRGGFGAAFSFLLFLVLFFIYEDLHAFDEKVASWLYGSPFIEAFHFFGETKVMIAGTVVFLIWYVIRRNYRGMLFVIFSMGGGIALNQMVKRIVERPRPELPDQLTTYSFTSTHTTIALLLLFTAAYIITEHMSRRSVKVAAWSLAIVLTILAGLSRIAEGRHFATDVLAAWALTYAWFTLCKYIYEKNKDESNPERG
ncbi:MAG: phosphatase PAP2 family protein [Lysinibacillus sp.]